jgi:hypothetical protein
MRSMIKQARKNKGKRSLNLSEPVAEFAQQRADARHEGNLSIYVRKLIQREMKKAEAA